MVKLIHARFAEPTPNGTLGPLSSTVLERLAPRVCAHQLYRRLDDIGEEVPSYAAFHREAVDLAERPNAIEHQL